MLEEETEKEVTNKKKKSKLSLRFLTEELRCEKARQAVTKNPTVSAYMCVQECMCVCVCVLQQTAQLDSGISVRVCSEMASVTL